MNTKPSTAKFNELLVREIAGAIREHVKSLVHRIEALEARPVPKWAGVFRQGEAYREASLCTHSGSLWLARRDTVIKPGSNGDWVLICKRGQFAQ